MGHRRLAKFAWKRNRPSNLEGPLPTPLPHTCSCPWCSVSPSKDISVLSDPISSALLLFLMVIVMFAIVKYLHIQFHLSHHIICLYKTDMGPPSFSWCHSQVPYNPSPPGLTVTVPGILQTNLWLRTVGLPLGVHIGNFMAQLFCFSLPASGGFSLCFQILAFSSWILPWLPSTPLLLDESLGNGFPMVCKTPRYLLTGIQLFMCVSISSFFWAAEQWNVGSSQSISLKGQCVISLQDVLLE